MKTLVKPKKKRFSIYKARVDRNPLYAQRQALIGDYVASSLKTFLTGERHRTCVTCGTPFKSKHRFHFNCGSPCLRTWRAGMLRARPQ